MKRTNTRTNITNGSILAAALFALGIGFSVPAQAADDEVSVTVATLEQDIYFATVQERTARTSPQFTPDNTEATNEAQGGAFANEPQWRRRVFESN